MDRFYPVKRTALDGVVWWVVWDNARKEYSSLLCFGKYRRKKDAEYAIRRATEKGRC